MAVLSSVTKLSLIRNQQDFPIQNGAMFKSAITSPFPSIRGGNRGKSAPEGNLKSTVTLGIPEMAKERYCVENREKNGRKQGG